MPGTFEIRNSAGERAQAQARGPQESTDLEHSLRMKKSAFRSNKKYYHVSLEYRTQHLLKDLDWIFIQKKISENALKYEVEVQALTMMDTHIHLLISNFENNENFFSVSLQNEIYETSNLENLTEPILNYSQYLNTYKYIYRNPVEAGLCQNAEDYPFSSLHFLLGKGFLHCQVCDHLGLIQNPLHILKWLNQDIDYKISQLKLLRQESSFSM